MAAPTLRHYSSAISATGLVQLVPAVATARALVISKIVLAANTNGTVGIFVGTVSVSGQLSVTPGTIYTENGLVLLAGETVQVNVSAIGGSGFLNVHVFGEEVDN